MLRGILSCIRRWSTRRAMKNPELESLDARINALLPPLYRGCFSEVEPASMGSAKVRYGPDGRPAWDEIWSTFCELALAGGPPHRGKLLEPVSPELVAAEPIQYREVIEEISRAIQLTTGLNAGAAEPGWIGVSCRTEAMATWLQFAIVAENVSCFRRDRLLLLPGGPDFRIEKEIKNVTVAIAKACHYWEGHLSGEQQASASLTAWEPTTKLAEYQAVVEPLSRGLEDAIGLPAILRYVGWAGIDTGSEDAAVWMLRAVVAEGVLARREATILYIPVGARYEVDEVNRVVAATSLAWRLWALARIPVEKTGL
jgi:sirohydrochlorin cobaltochelatase